jgi:hypothetical protein
MFQSQPVKAHFREDSHPSPYQTMNINPDRECLRWG